MSPENQNSKEHKNVMNSKIVRRIGVIAAGVALAVGAGKMLSNSGEHQIPATPDNAISVEKGSTTTETNKETSQNQSPESTSLSEQAVLVDFNAAFERGDYTKMKRMPGEVIVLSSDDEGISAVANPVVFEQESGDKYAIYFTPGENEAELKAVVYQKAGEEYTQGYTAWVNDSEGHRLELPVNGENIDNLTGAIKHFDDYKDLGKYFQNVAEQYEGASVGHV